MGTAAIAAANATATMCRIVIKVLSVAGVLLDLAILSEFSRSVNTPPNILYRHTRTPSLAGYSAQNGTRKHLQTRALPVATHGLRPHQIEPPHLAIEVRALDAEHARGVGNPPAMLLQDRGNIVALELGARLAERGIEPGGAHAAFELRVRQDVLEPDEAAGRQQDQALEQRAQLQGVAAPRQRGEQRECRPRQCLHRLAA